MKTLVLTDCDLLVSLAATRARSYNASYSAYMEIYVDLRDKRSITSVFFYIRSDSPSDKETARQETQCASYANLLGTPILTKV